MEKSVEKSSLKSRIGRYSRRGFLGFLAFDAADFALEYFLFRPGPEDFDPAKKPSPTAGQVEFLGALKRKFELVCLGNTELEKPEISNFVFNPALTAEFAQAGARGFYFEQYDMETTAFNPRFTKPKKFGEECNRSSEHEVQPILDKRKYVCDAFSGALFNPPARDMIFMAVYPKNGKHIPSFTRIEKDIKVLDPLVKGGVRETVFNTQKLMQKIVFGRNDLDTPGFRAIGRKLQLTHTLGVPDDDGPTVSFLKDMPGSKVLLYESGHFLPTHEHSLRHYLDKTGKKYSVVNIYRDAAHSEIYWDNVKKLEKESSVKFALPDAEVWLTAPPEHRFGINIINPAIGPVYEYAMRKAASRPPEIPSGPR